MTYATRAPERAEIDALPGLTLLEFGVDWCPHCQGAQVAIAGFVHGQPQIGRHLKIEDGPGRPLGRSFRVKLWPTLILIDNGREVARCVRPTSSEAIRQALCENAGGGIAKNGDFSG